MIETKRGARCRVLEGGSGAPVVSFHGASGLLRYAERLAALIPGARVEPTDATGPMLPWEAPEAFAARVAAFLG